MGEHRKRDMTTREELVELLCEFFLDKFKEDAAGVGDWLAQGGQDADVVIPAVEALKVRLASRQEVSVEELLAVLKDWLLVGNNMNERRAIRERARDLLAAYSITRRTTEG